MPGPAADTTPRRISDCRRTAASVVCLVSLSVVSFGCSREANLKEAITVTELSGGWYDGGVVDDKNKLVPSVRFRLEKNSGETIGPLSTNVLFKRLVGGVEEEFEDVYLQRVEFSEGNRTQLLTVRPETGYTGDPPQSRADMLQNSHFVDVRAIIFVRQGATWIELARLDLPRTLLTQ
jgi:hypothetical protein